MSVFKHTLEESRQAYLKCSAEISINALARNSAEIKKHIEKHKEEIEQNQKRIKEIKENKKHLRHSKMHCEITYGIQINQKDLK